MLLYCWAKRPIGTRAVTASRTARVIAFHRPMGTPAPEIPQHPPQSVVAAQVHGNTSQRRNNYLAGGALLVSLLVGGMNAYWHLSSESKKDNDDHVNELVKEQIKPVGEI